MWWEQFRRHCIEVLREPPHIAELASGHLADIIQVCNLEHCEQSYETAPQHYSWWEQTAVQVSHTPVTLQPRNIGSSHVNIEADELQFYCESCYEVTTKVP